MKKKYQQIQNKYFKISYFDYLRFGKSCIQLILFHNESTCYKCALFFNIF